MPASTRNRIISTAEPLDLSGVPTCMRELHEATFDVKPKLKKNRQKIPLKVSEPRRSASFPQKGTHTGSQKPSDIRRKSALGSARR